MSRRLKNVFLTIKALIKLSYIDNKYSHKNIFVGTLDPRKLIEININHMNNLHMKISQITVLHICNRPTKYVVINCMSWLADTGPLGARNITHFSVLSLPALAPIWWPGMEQQRRWYGNVSLLRICQHQKPCPWTWPTRPW